uniref:Trafficking protein particle complex subunit 2-like protein n=1 Tax=Eutreptiella gymnastica TaxID=73025 RepID=A0A7S4GI79_9EUGL
MAVSACAVIGKWNNPLYIKVWMPPSGQDELKLPFLLHSCLDIVEEKLRAQTPPDLFLGPLIPIEEFRTYGYVGNTQTKLIVATLGEAQEAHIKRLCQKLNDYVVATICNPFYTPDTPINSREFDSRVESLFSSQPPTPTHGRNWSVG